MAEARICQDRADVIHLPASAANRSYVATSTLRGCGGIRRLALPRWAFSRAWQWSSAEHQLVYAQLVSRRIGGQPGIGGGGRARCEGYRGMLLAPDGRTGVRPHQR